MLCQRSTFYYFSFRNESTRFTCSKIDYLIPFELNSYLPLTFMILHILNILSYTFAESECLLWRQSSCAFAVSQLLELG